LVKPIGFIHALPRRSLDNRPHGINSARHKL
jgi:hypothetical protein